MDRTKHNPVNQKVGERGRRCIGHTSSKPDIRTPGSSFTETTGLKNIGKTETGEEERELER